MKNFFIYTSILMFFALGSVVSAQEDVVENESLLIPQKRFEIKERFEQKKTELHSQIEQKRFEIKERFGTTTPELKIKLESRAQERISKITSQIFEISEATLVKFDGIAFRLTERIAKLDEKDVDTTKSQDLLDQAKLKIEEATTLVAATRIEIENSIQTEISKEEIKNSIEACKTSIKQAHMSLVEVIISLKSTTNSDPVLLNE